MRLLPLFVAALLAAGCIYKIDIEQGNYVTSDLVAKLKPGMTKAQVKEVLGTPLLSDMFHNDRWDYYFDNAKRGRSVDHKKFVVLFKDDKLVSWAGDTNPPPPPPTNPNAMTQGAQ
jgi:outer membrane protein assembly factor BamE